jgi:hypothetical protein
LEAESISWSEMVFDKEPLPDPRSKKMRGAGSTTDRAAAVAEWSTQVSVEKVEKEDEGELVVVVGMMP